MHEKTFGRALEMEAEDELPENVDGRLTGKSRKSTRKLNVLSPSFCLLMRVEKQCVESQMHCRVY